MRFPSSYLLVNLTVTFLLPGLPCSASAADAPKAANSSKALQPVHEPHLLPMQAFEAMSPVEVVVNAYAKFERLTQASETQISLQVSDVKIWPVDQFDQLSWSSIADFPENGGIGAGRVGKLHADRKRSVAYRARWLKPDEYWFSMPPSLRKDPRTVQKVLEVAAPHMPEVLDIDTIVTFLVTIDLEGRQERYQAAMLLWHGPEGIDRIRPVDYFLQSLEQAIAERPALLTNEVQENLDSQTFIAEELGHHWRRPGTQNEKSSCIAFSSGVEQIKNISGNNAHISGSHTVEAEFELDCECDSSCYSTCSAGTAWEQCVDTGTRAGSFCHKLTHNSEQKNGNSLGGGTTCGAAYGCTQVTCTTPLCNLCSGVGLTIGGGPLGFTLDVDNSGGVPDWKGLIQNSLSCPPCTETPDGTGNTEPPQDGGDPSNGGSGNPPSPILINFTGDFRLTGLDDPVTFDIDADDFAETLGWSTREGDEAFLALDRNGNGWIDDGTELFGNFTEQPKSETPNGFDALKVFDEVVEGGNHDGYISADDAVFDSLLLWRDSDHDGVSDPEELFPLATSLVVSISLDYFDSDLQDPHGNQLRYLSYVQLANQPRPRVAAIDVFFVAEDEP